VRRGDGVVAKEFKGKLSFHMPQCRAPDMPGEIRAIPLGKQQISLYFWAEVP